jgi:hypothetical protein
MPACAPSASTTWSAAHWRSSRSTSRAPRSRSCAARPRPFVALEHGLGSADHYGTRPETIHALLRDCGMDVFDLDGGGPYDAAAFARAFDAQERVNWLARPWA